MEMTTGHTKKITKANGKIDSPKPEIPEVTVIEIGEIQFVLRSASARTYIEYNTWARSKPVYADDFLIKSIYTVEGESLTDLQLQLLSGRQKQKLLRVVSSFDSLVTMHDGATEFEDSEDFTIGTTRIKALPIPAVIFTALKRGLAANAGKTLEEFTLNYYQVDGQPIEKQMLEDLYPKGIGFTAMQAIATHLISPLIPSQPTQI